MDLEIAHCLDSGEIFYFLVEIEQPSFHGSSLTRPGNELLPLILQLILKMFELPPVPKRTKLL